MFPLFQVMREHGFFLDMIGDQHILFIEQLHCVAPESLRTIGRLADIHEVPGFPFEQEV